ncbi:hypothetical protein STIAU_0657 [Stigmatella aurantiaca DW4/3-1]|uniref:Uncharacterized protein n=1 Tax=Stigmatella aurantiaca (strain DW4/3-1) TaxID=378806 RepID=Q08T97_STIAD|nr:hypothetical protein STIAU_0657 [Stigmatella aurantiaca DW4/3-1]
MQPIGVFEKGLPTYSCTRAVSGPVMLASPAVARE